MSKQQIILFFVGWGTVVVVLALTVWGSRPMTGDSVDLTIPQGMSRLDIAKTLHDKGVIRSQWSFLVALAFAGGQVAAGEYRLDPNQNVAMIVRTLNGGSNQTVRLTVPEGWRREQIAARLTELGLDGAGFLKLTEDKEGYLFPDTYFLKHDATPEQILEKFSANFAGRTEGLNPTPEQIILASIVEREAKNETERPIIAAIYQNRLNIGMKLDADPTVQYARDNAALIRGEKVEKFWEPIMQSDYQNVRSPYNTYLTAGLPPGPIANPGLASIKAAITPAATNALYFFHKENGEIVTSTTLEEHNRQRSSN